MNERIKELAEQANWWKPLGLPSDWDEGDYVVSPEQMKKFAELIVKECMELTHWKDFEMSVEQRIRLSVYQDIKEHFGVEE